MRRDHITRAKERYLISGERYICSYRGPLIVVLSLRNIRLGGAILVDFGMLSQFQHDGIERGSLGCIFVKAKEEKVGASGPDELMF